MPWPPITMATQHPDNAAVPWWRSEAFIPTQDEIDELTLLFKELPIDEYMWDWEGKYVDESVGEKLLGITLGPEKPRHAIHRNLTSTIFHRLHGEPNDDALRRDIVDAGTIRRSLG